MVDTNVTNEDVKEAKVSLAEARKEMKKIHDWYDGTFDQNHPDFVAINSRLDKATEKVEGDNGLEARSAAMGKDLELVIGALTGAQQSLVSALEEVRQQQSQFARALEQSTHPEQIAAVIMDVRNSVEKVQSIHQVARAAAREFRKQFPNLDTLRNLVNNGDDAISTLDLIERFGDGFDRARASTLQSAVYKASTAVRSTLARLEQTTGDADLLSIAAEQGSGVCAYAERMHEFSAALLGSEADASAEFQDHAKKNAELGEQLTILLGAVAKAKGDAADAKQLRLGSARFGKVTRSGGEWTAVEETMTELFEAHTKDKSVQRITVHSPWDQRTEARWRNDRWIVGTYHYVGGTLLAKLPDGRYRVYRVSFRRTQQPGGEFGPLAVWGIGHSYEILAENIDK